MSRKISDEEIQQAFDLAYTLHPNQAVAMRVTMDACDVLSLLKRRQARRKRSNRHYKTSLSSDRLLQFAVFFVSDIRERDQESPTPLMEPKYKPTRDDLVVRYLKHLIWKTTLLNSQYVAVGLGCLLYSYKPSEIADLLGMFEENNLRHVKMRISRDLNKRFFSLGVVKGNTIRTKPASEHDRMLVQLALEALTPWHTAHISPASEDDLILQTLFDEKNPIAEWNRKHALIDPKCAGLARLIKEYNSYLRSKSSDKTLPDPLESLVLPDFGGTTNPPLQRFKRRLLSENEKMLLSERHKPSGPWAYDIDALELYLRRLGLNCDVFEQMFAESEDGCGAGQCRVLDFGNAKTGDDDATIQREVPTILHPGARIPSRLFLVDPPGDAVRQGRKNDVILIVDAAGAPLGHRNLSVSWIAVGGHAGKARLKFADGYESLLKEWFIKERLGAARRLSAAEADYLRSEPFVHVWKEFDQGDAEAQIRRWLFSVATWVIDGNHRHRIRDWMEPEHPLIFEMMAKVAARGFHADVDPARHRRLIESRLWLHSNTARTVVPRRRGRLEMRTLSQKEIAEYMVRIDPNRKCCEITLSNIKFSRKAPSPTPDETGYGVGMTRGNANEGTLSLKDFHRTYAISWGADEVQLTDQFNACKKETMDRGACPKFEKSQEEYDETRKPDATPTREVHLVRCDIKPRIEHTDRYNRLRGCLIVNSLISQERRSRGFEDRRAGMRVEPAARGLSVELSGALDATNEGSRPAAG